MKMGMIRRLSKPMAKFRPVNRKMQPKPASLAQRKTVDAGRRFVGKYTAADLVSGNGAKAQRTAKGTQMRGAIDGAGSTGVSSEARVTARGPSANVASGSPADASSARKVDDGKAELRPDFRPEFARDATQKKRGEGF